MPCCRLQQLAASDMSKPGRHSLDKGSETHNDSCVTSGHVSSEGLPINLKMRSSCAASLLPETQHVSSTTYQNTITAQAGKAVPTAIPKRLLVYPSGYPTR